MKFNLRQKLKMRCVKDSKNMRIHGCRFQQDLKIARIKSGWKLSQKTRRWWVILWVYEFRIIEGFGVMKLFNM